MPIVLHIPKPERSARTPLLEAAARAVVAACLMSGRRIWRGPPLPMPDLPELAQLVRERIRKIARRARGTHWERSNRCRA